MNEIRGDEKNVNKGIMKSVDILGCDRQFSLFLIMFCVLMNIIVFPSLIELGILIITGLGLMVGRAIYNNDPCFFKVFFKNMIFDDKPRQYLHPQSNANKISIKNPMSVRLK